MVCLPLANILHHKLRTVLCALGIGIGICMLITLSGLARGTLYEVAERWESVDADLIVFPRGWGNSAATRSGVGLSDGNADLILREHPDMVRSVVPVFTWLMQLGGQDQMVAGVDPEHFRTLTGGKRLDEGRLFDRQGKFAAWIEAELSPGKAGRDAFDPTEADLSNPEHNGLEIVIDRRLAKSEGYKLGTRVFAANHHWTVVGIVPAGVMTRVFMPRRTAQFLFGGADIRKSTLMFVKLRAGVDVGPASKAIRGTTDQDVVPLSSYRGMLIAKWGIMLRYVDIVNGIALVIAFLFTTIILYTMVLQQSREIAILKSCGASGAFILRQVMGESMLLTVGGLIAGIAMSFLAAWLIEVFMPLYTVTITWQWIAIAAAAAAAGASVSALYPAWRAAKVDMVEALMFE